MKILGNLEDKVHVKRGSKVEIGQKRFGVVYSRGNHERRVVKV